MENNPERKPERTGKADRPDKTDKTGKEDRKGKTDETGKTGRKDKKGTGQRGETSYERLNKALAVHEKALEKNPDSADAWAGKAAVYLRHRMYRIPLKRLKKPLKSSLKIQVISLKKVSCSCNSTRKKLP